MDRAPSEVNADATTSYLPRVVVAGGGFGGYHAARALERLLAPDRAEIVVVDARNYLLYTPFMAAVAGGLREPRHITFALRELLPQSDVRVVAIESAAPDRNCLQVTNLDGKREDLAYDHLVVSVGSVTRMAPVAGLAEHALGFKTLNEATALRDRLIRVLDTAETLDDDVERQAYLTFVVVGAGYAGLGGMAKLRDFASAAIERYPRCRQQGMRWLLVDVNDRVMAAIPASLSRFAARQLRRRDITIVSETTVTEVGPAEVRLSDGTVVATRTVLWSAGVEPSPVTARLGLPLDATGRIVVDDHMRVDGHDNVWAIGDAAAVPDPTQPGRACPPTRQHAIKQGEAVAANIAAHLGTGRTAPFAYRTRGVFVGLGKGQAVVEVKGLRLRGRAAWALTGAYNLKHVPGRANKARLLNDWAMDLLLPRIASESGQAAYPLDAANGVAPGRTVHALRPSANPERMAVEPHDDGPAPSPDPR